MKELNLLPQAYKERLIKNKLLQKYSLYLLVFILIALGMNILPNYLLRQNQNKLSQINININDEKYIEPVEISRRIMDLQSELELYESVYDYLSQPVISSLETYKQLVAQLPGGVKIETISFTNSDRTVMVSGISVSRKQVSEFVSNISVLRIVNEVTILELELMGENAVDNSIDYRIQVFLNVSEDDL